MAKIAGHEVDVRQIDGGCSLSAVALEHSSEAPILVGSDAHGDGIALRYDKGVAQPIAAVAGAGLLSVAASEAGGFAMGGIGVVVVGEAGRTTEFRDEWAGCRVNTVRFFGSNTI